MYSISRLARLVGLSRSTLLYYDRIGLLVPSGRSGAGYRLYSPADRERLERICAFRQAGLGVEDVRTILATDGATADILQRRLSTLGAEIREMQARQRLLAGMLKGIAAGPWTRVDKEAWVEMLRAAGMDEEGMRCWHAEFERRTPEAHHEFLLSLGIDEEEALLIRKWSAGRG